MLTLVRRCLLVLAGVSLSSTLALAKAGAVPAALMERARVEGSVRVIVHLDVPTQPEGYLAAVAVTDQRGAIASAADAVLADCSGTTFRVGRRFDTLPFVALEAAADALAALDRSDSVAAVSEDRFMAPLLNESVTLVEGTQAHAAGFDGTGWAVAVLDTGVEGGHVMLSGKVKAQACFSFNSSCPNGSSMQIGGAAGAPCTYEAGCRHGTHVAGIAAGNASFMSDGTPISGVGKGADLIAIQVFSRQDCGGTPCAQAASSDVAAALEHVASLRTTFKIAAVNLSLGGERYTTRAACNNDSANALFRSAMASLLSFGIASVAASGNNNYSDSMQSPACLSEAVSVGNSTKSNSIYTDAEFGSNAAPYGPDLLAPGTQIVSAISGVDTLEAYTGTSMATPHVAGAWAILKQKSPSATPNDILTALRNTGLLIRDPRNGISYPRIRIKQALDALAGGTSSPSVSITMSKSTYVNGDTITASEFRIKNAGSATNVKLRIWVKVPGVGEVDVISIGADGSFQLPGSLDVNLGPFSLFTVSSAFPKGSWELNSRVSNPTTNVVLSEDLNPFTVQ